MLNRSFCGIDKTTDVLSFPQISQFRMRSIEPKRHKFKILKSEFRIPKSEILLGDIVINLHRAERQAIEQGITMNEEVKRLIIHGLLHLLGYDHEKNRYQKKKMELKERELYDAC